MATLLGLASCTKDNFGTVHLGLTGQSHSGRTYRLRNGELALSGANASLVFHTEDDPTRTSLSARLPAGPYSLRLAAGWRVERVSPSGSADPVNAILVSTNPQAFQVVSGDTASVVLHFRIGSDDVAMGDGQVSVGVDFDDADGGVDGGAPVADLAVPADLALPPPDLAPPPPSITITDSPRDPWHIASPMVAFVSAHAASIQCFLDGAQLQACASPLQLGPLADGRHTIELHALATDGRLAAATAAFTIDTVPPVVTVTQTTINPATHNATFFFQANEPVTGFNCQFADIIFGCSSPFTVPPGQTPGTYTITFRTWDLAENQGEKTLSFTIP
jgi:hypothetical protein